MCFGLRRQWLICGCRRCWFCEVHHRSGIGFAEGRRSNRLPRNGFLLTGGRPCRQILDNGFKYRNVVACGSLPLYTLTFIHEWNDAFVTILVDVLWIAATVRLICGCLIGAASLWLLASFFAVTNSWQWSQIPQCGSRISLFPAAIHEWSDAS